jgi:hypothetical protein
MKKVKKKRFRKIRKGLKYGILAGLLLHAGSQLTYWANDIYHAIKPSTHRAKFEEQFGFPLKGWSGDIERDQQNVSMIADTIARERQGRDFRLESIRIRDRNYLKQPIWDQFDSIITIPSSGYYILDRIVLDDYVQKSTLHHECKHAKAYDIIAEHPEFLEKWKILARDKSGESLYLSEGEQICSRVRGLGSLVDGKKQIFSENEKLGFISNYARTNVHEDIAELCEAAETNSQSFKEFLFGGPEYRNDILAKKIALAQEYGLIPAEFTDFVKLEDMFLDSAVWHGYIDQEKAQPFMRESEEFLNKNPNSVYESQLRSSRAYVLSQGIHGYPKPRNSVDDVIREYRGVLTSEYKEGFVYAGALQKLSEIYNLELRDEKTSDIFVDAEREYWKRFKEGVVDLSRNGVNDFLTEKGIEKQ